MNTRWLIAGVVALLATTAGPAAAQGGGQQHGQPMNRGQAKKAERQAQANFNDHDRQIANNWYHQNRSRQLPPGLRDRDRLPPPMEARLRAGAVLDQDMRRRVYPAPVALVRGFAPAPRGYRYVVIGGHVVLVDTGYRVFDVISLSISLGP
jgi:Ni/Co efflux regulator RcnB